MRDPLERSPDMPQRREEQVPPMPVNLPTEDTDNPHSTPLREDEDIERPDPALPPEPGRDPEP